jgi:hypothetical protein
MVAEVYASIGAFKAMFDMARGLKDINDDAIRNTAVIALQEKILSAQAEQSALIERIHILEKQVADFETWEDDRNRYELEDLGSSALAYMLKREFRTTEPPHFVCTNCFGQHRISIIQQTSLKKGEGIGFFCPACRSQIMPSSAAFEGGTIKWLD